MALAWKMTSSIIRSCEHKQQFNYKALTISNHEHKHFKHYDDRIWHYGI